MKKFWNIVLSSILLSAVLTPCLNKTEATASMIGYAEESALTSMESPYKFNFTNQEKPGYQSVTIDVYDGAPLYNASVGYGFVNETSAMPPREVHTGSITSDGTGFYITEPFFYAEPRFENDNYNNFGMAFRIQAPPGAYSVYVKTTSDAADTTVSVSGMQTSRLLSGGFWDAARLVPKKVTAAARGKEWTYTYVMRYQDLNQKMS